MPQFGKCNVLIMDTNFRTFHEEIKVFRKNRTKILYERKVFNNTTLIIRFSASAFYKFLEFFRKLAFPMSRYSMVSQQKS